MAVIVEHWFWWLMLIGNLRCRLAIGNYPKTNLYKLNLDLVAVSQDIRADLFATPFLTGVIACKWFSLFSVYNNLSGYRQTGKCNIVFQINVIYLASHVRIDRLNNKTMNYQNDRIGVFQLDCEPFAEPVNVSAFAARLNHHRRRSGIYLRQIGRV